MRSILTKDEFDKAAVQQCAELSPDSISALGVLEIDDYSDLRAEFGMSVAEIIAGRLYSFLSEDDNERMLIGKVSDSTYFLGFRDYSNADEIDDYCSGMLEKISGFNTEPPFTVSIGIVSTTLNSPVINVDYRTVLDRAFRALMIARRENTGFYHLYPTYTSKKYRVLLVEDQSLPRQLIENMLNDSNKYVVINSITNADLAHFYCAQGNIDLVVMDVLTDMGANGLDASARIKKSFPDIKIVIITSMPEVSYLRRAREANVDSFWYKEIDDISLIEVIDRTMKGEHVYPDKTPEVALGLISSYELTDREIEVLRELMSGETNQEIASKLYISVNTVRDHISNMLLKTGLNSRTELAVRAREIGLVILDRNNQDR